MPSKEPRTCPICHRPFIVNLNQHLNGVHGICGQERKQLIQRGMIGAEVTEATEPQSNTEKHIVFLDMLQRGDLLRSELLKKARPKELKAILELCLNMKEGNLAMPKGIHIVLSSHHSPTEIFHCPIRKHGC